MLRFILPKDPRPTQILKNTLEENYPDTSAISNLFSVFTSAFSPIDKLGILGLIFVLSLMYFENVLLLYLKRDEIFIC